MSVLDDRRKLLKKQQEDEDDDLEGIESFDDEEDDLNDDDDFYDEEPSPNERKPKRVLKVAVISVIVLATCCTGYAILSHKGKDKVAKQVSADVSVSTDANKAKKEEELPGIETGVDEAPNEQPSQPVQSTGAPVFNPNKAKEQMSQPVDVPETDNQSQTNEYKEKIDAGVPDLYVNEHKQVTSRPVHPKQFMKDIQGNRIPCDYNVVKYEWRSDYVNYKKHRAVMGDGVEQYWLDSVWHGIHYNMVIPLSQYQELDDEGIVSVKLEVTCPKEGDKVITYMELIPNAKQALDRERKK